MTIENPPLSAPNLLVADAPDRHRNNALKVRICLLLAPSLVGLQVLSYVLQISLHGYPAILVLMNPAGPFLADLFARSPHWVYLTIGGLRCVIFMPNYYFVGKYGQECMQARIERRQRKTGRMLMWPAKLKQAANRAFDPLRSRIANISVVGLSRNGCRRDPSDRNFPKFGWLFVFIRPNAWMLMAAGATKMNPWATGVAAVTGTLAWLTMVAFLGEYIPHFVLFVFSIF